MRNAEIAALLQEHDVRPTTQRMSVYKFLDENRVHPSVDVIYQSLLEDHPNFSRTTVYNSLQALCGAGLVRQVKVDESKVCYDACIEPHGHFFCKKCGKLYDFPIELLEVSGLDHFRIDAEHVAFEGVCKHCLD